MWMACGWIGAWACAGEFKTRKASSEILLKTSSLSRGLALASSMYTVAVAVLSRAIPLDIVIVSTLPCFLLTSR